jgi:hypothetical protein
MHQLHQADCERLLNYETMFVLLLIVAALTVSAQTNSVHNWTLKSGAVFPGDYFTSGAKMVVIKSHGTNCLLKISDLSTNDWLYFQDCKAAQRQRQLAAEAEAKQQIADEQQDMRDKVAGIYEFEERNGRTQVLDFRSDGSVVSYYYARSHVTQLYNKKTSPWTSSKNSISIAGVSSADAGLSFRPEGLDLIDEKGNRWFRIH